MVDLHIGVLNLMPQAEKYMPVLQSVFPTNIKLKWFRLYTHPYKSSDKINLHKTHKFLDKAALDNLDGLIITGAPLDKHSYSEVLYWDELKQTVTLAHSNLYSIMGICWGAMALGKIFFNIEKQILSKKIFGVYELKILIPMHLLSHTMDDYFFCPQSRYATMDKNTLEHRAQKGDLILLDYSDELGYSTMATPSISIVMHQGHIEYPTNRLAEEYFRDYNAGVPNLSLPVNYSVDTPINRWKANGQAFFRSWVQQINNIKKIYK